MPWKKTHFLEYMVLYKVSSKQNERWATQAQPTEPLVLMIIIKIYINYDHLNIFDRDKMSNLYRGPSIDAAYQVSVHLAMQFQRRFVRNQPIRNKNCLWWPCLLTDRGEMRNLYRGPSIDASYHSELNYR
jgi:hypothetical protein